MFLNRCLPARCARTVSPTEIGGGKNSERTVIINAPCFFFPTKKIAHRHIKNQAGGMSRLPDCNEKAAAYSADRMVGAIVVAVTLNGVGAGNVYLYLYAWTVYVSPFRVGRTLFVKL